jgi:protein SCO1/2
MIMTGQTKTKRTAIWGASALWLLVCTCPVWSGDGAAPQAELAPRQHSIDFTQKLGNKVPLDASFFNEEGKPINLGDCISKDRPTILIMAYHRCPMLCNQVFGGLMDTIRAMRTLHLGKDFNVVCVDFDPKEQPVQALQRKRIFLNEYGRKGTEEGCHFLTGKKDNIDKVTEAVGFNYEFDKMLKEYNHPSGLIILSPEGIVSRYLPGIEFLDRNDFGNLTDDPTKTMRLSLVQAGEGKIGSKADKAFLTCYRYDPHTGKYSADVRKLMSAAGLFTLLLIAGLYAKTNWNLPGVRVLVIGVVAYVALIPVIMFAHLPSKVFFGMYVGAALGVIVLGRYMWKAANSRTVASEAVPHV